MNYITIFALIIGIVSLVIGIRGIFTDKKVRKDILDAQKDVKTIKEDTKWLHDIKLKERIDRHKKEFVEFILQDKNKN